MGKEAEEPESFVDLDVSRDGPMRFRYVPRLAAVGYCACAERPYRAYEFLSLGRLLWSVDLYNGSGLRVQIFGLTYADFDPDIDPAAIDSDLYR